MGDKNRSCRSMWAGAHTKSTSDSSSRSSDEQIFHTEVASGRSVCGVRTFCKRLQARNSVPLEHGADLFLSPQLPPKFVAKLLGPRFILPRGSPDRH